MPSFAVILICLLFFFNSASAQTARLWATYCGGTGDENGNPLLVAIDASGNVYIGGSTSSTAGIATGGAYQTTYGGGFGDAFLIKFDSNGNRLWGTYVGGTGNDFGFAMTTDAYGNVYIGGRTASTTGISFGGHQNTFGGIDDAFLVKFDGSGKRVWATYYGGTLTDIGYGVKTDKLGNVFLMGYSQSSSPANCIYTAGAFKGAPNGIDGFIVKFDGSGTRQWGTFFGGTGTDYIKSADFDTLGNVYIGGFTTSANNIVLAGGFQTVLGGGNEAYLAKLDPTGSTQIWGTYYGGAGNESAYNIAVDPSGYVYMTGTTTSPTTSAIASAGAHQATSGGGTDLFLVKFDSYSCTRSWGTYFGGSASEIGAPNVSLNKMGNVYLTGSSASTSGIASNAFQNTSGGGTDGFLAAFDSAGCLISATYYGGSATDEIGGSAPDTLGNIYISGATSSTSGIAFNGVQDTLGGGADAFLAKFSASSSTGAGWLKWLNQNCTLCPKGCYIDRGAVSPTRSLQTVSASADTTNYGYIFWSFNASADSTYYFDLCSSTGVSGTTVLRIHNARNAGNNYCMDVSSTPTLMLQNSSNGCVNTGSGLSKLIWTCPKSGTYYLESGIGICQSSYSFWGMLGSQTATLNYKTLPSYSFTCSEVFYDKGVDGTNGSSANYNNNEDWVYTYYPADTVSQAINVLFTSFSTSPGDVLCVYDGSSINAPQIGCYAGPSITGAFSSTASNGALTFHFTTDDSLASAGWQANVSCIPNVGISNNYLVNKISIYPNPAADKLWVTGYGLGVNEATIEMYDVLGEKVLNTKPGTVNSKLETTIDISSLAKGVYFIHISDENKVYNTKIIKQ